MSDQPREPERLAKCARCKRPAPPPVRGPEGQAAQGWVTYESEQELVIDIPEDEFVLPPALARAIGDHDGLVRLVPLGPEIAAPAPREVLSNWYGVACPDCQAETGWDWFEWVMFMSGLGEEDDA